ncbi:MAG: PTS glucose transporter subunit IIA [Eisenbergiella sp.]
MQRIQNWLLRLPNVIPLNKVRDEAFCFRALGNGVGIRRKAGFTPFDGTATVVFPTGHAIGLTDRRGMSF